MNEHPLRRNRRLTYIVPAVSVALAVSLSGCGSDDTSSSADTTVTTAAPETTTTEAPTTTAAATTTVPAGAPTEPLVASSPDWVEACKIGDTLVAQAWQLKLGTSTDKTVVAVSMLQMIDKIPAGGADAEIAFLKEVINAYVGGSDLEQYKANFRANADALLAKVATGCGVEDGGQLPLPENAIGEIEDFLFA